MSIGNRYLIAAISPMRYAGGMARRKDFLEAIVAERSAKRPEFGDMVEAALDRRRLLRALAEKRERSGVSQTVVAARMGTSQSAVARLEAGEIDAKLSTIGRYASAIGQHVTWKVEAPKPATKAGSAKRAK